MNKNLLYLILVVLAGCNAGKETPTSVYFSGEIVNPTSKHVVLYKGDVVIGSSTLDDNNMFSFQLDSIEDGLYHFNHAPEYQYVHLEKGDSLIIRLNTVDFDESLVFSGDGEEINNFLMEVYLAFEKEDRLITEYYSLPPTEFSKRIDSLARLKMKLLNELKVEAVLSEKETEIAEANIVYNYAVFKEKYPFKHKKYTQNRAIPKLSKEYYAYRKKLSYDNKDLTYLRSYYVYMINHFGNLSYMSCSHGCDIKDKMVKNHLHFNKHKLKLIDSLVIEKELKDNLFRNVALDYLLKVHDSQENNKIFIKVFHALSENNKHIQEIDGIYEGIKNIQPNNRIPEIDVLNLKGEQVSLQDIAKNNKTVFYFWTSTDKRHFKDISKQIALLAQQKPRYKFVGISIKTNDDDWNDLIRSSGLNAKNQYKAIDFEELSKALIIYPLNQCIVTENEMIVDAFADIYTSFK